MHERNQVTTQAYFEEIDQHLIKELNNAKESILICVAWISWRKYTSIFNRLSKKGIKIEIIYYNDMINAKYLEMPDKEVNIFAVKPRFGKYMHNKFCIIDNKIVITGSFNWSKTAVLHFENILIVKNDWKLVKSYLHEFYDIKDFYNYENKNKIGCHKNNCVAGAYNLAILGSESGKYDESYIEVWNICLSKENSGIKLKDEYAQYLHTHLGLKDGYFNQYFEDEYDQNSMLSEFHNERKIITDAHNYFYTTFEVPINAVGQVVMINPNEHLEYNEDPEYIIEIIWRDMFFRKLIPTEIYDDGYYFANRIIENHI